MIRSEPKLSVVASSVCSMSSIPASLDAPLPPTAAACIDELADLERLKAAICARQARLVAQVDELQPGVSEASLGQQVGLARHESPHRGRRLARLGLALVGQHPRVLALLEAGAINEHRAELIVRETEDLPVHARPAVDDRIAADLDAHPEWGDRDVVEAARRVVQRADPEGATRRRDRAVGRRHVSSRSHGDGTATVAGLVPDHQMVAIMQSLQMSADVLRASGSDDRTRAQIVADLFVQRLTGQVTATASPIAIQLVVPAETLLADGDEPADLPGAGPIPAPIARRLVHASPEASTTIRRLFADTDHLVAMESVASHVTGLMRQFIGFRDRRCRTPWCDAPIRHVDHVRRRADGGPTSTHNTQGLCEACNLLAEEAGWSKAAVSHDAVEAHEVEVVTPTGHRHRSREPGPPTAGRHDYVEWRPGVYRLAA